MYIVVFFLLLWTLFQCILCENCLDLVKNPDPNTLYLLSVQNDIHNSLSSRILENFKKISNSDIHNLDIKTDCPGQLKRALKLTKNMRYVIYYGITDFYKNNYNDIRKSDMEWAGDYKEQLICTSDESISMDVSPIEDIKKRANANCSLHRTQEYTMLISKYINIKETPRLYDLIYSDKFSETNDERSKRNEYNIILCNDVVDAHNRIIFKDTFKTIRVQYFPWYLCEYAILYGVTDNVIAIIAPGPEYIGKLDSYADKPIIFYNAMNNNEMVDMYKNAIIRKTELKDEARTLWNLISLRWKRVAILSDGSAESRAFEKEVRTLFDLKKVSYTVRSVEGSKCCDFNEALSSLQSVDARIIITNVDQQYADLLVKQAHKKGMTRNQSIIWIARAWSETTCLRAAKDLQTILTVSIESNPDDAIRVIETLFEEDYEYSAFLHEAKFAQDIRKKYQKYLNFQVVKTESSGDQFRGISRAIKNMPSDRAKCTLRSDNFDRPCDDMVGIMIALVIVVFAVTVLGITYFFDEPYTPYNRMAN